MASKPLPDHQSRPPTPLWLNASRLWPARWGGGGGGGGGNQRFYILLWGCGPNVLNLTVGGWTKGFTSYCEGWAKGFTSYCGGVDQRFYILLGTILKHPHLKQEAAILSPGWSCDSSVCVCVCVCGGGGGAGGGIIIKDSN